MNFVPEALAKGASGVLASRLIDGPCVQVADTTAALEALAAAARARASGVRCAAVTGSVGKTSVTQAVATALRQAGAAHSSVKSHNNHIGVPLTLARMPRDTRFAVFEVGMNHAGEIRPLSRLIRPDVAVVTLVGPVHVGNFTNGEAGVADAKAELFEGFATCGTAILGADGRWFEVLRDAALARGASVLTFGTGTNCDARLVSFERTGSGTAGGGVAGSVVRLQFHGRDLMVRLAQPGAHWAGNCLMTLLAVEALGAPVECAMESLETFAPLPGRGAERPVRITDREAVLVDESYNANPVSMRAALEILSARPAAGRRVVALTDMLELGDDARAMHVALAEAVVAARIDQVFAAGPMMREMFDALPRALRGAWAEHAVDLVAPILKALRTGDVIMVKGSNGSRASVIAAGITAASKDEGAPAPGI